MRTESFACKTVPQEDRVYVVVKSLVDANEIETLEKANIVERVRNHDLHGSLYVKHRNGQTRIIPDTHRIDKVMLYPYLGEVNTWFVFRNAFTLQSKFATPLTYLFYGKGNSVQLEFRIQRFNKKILSADVRLFL